MAEHEGIFGAVSQKNRFITTSEVRRFYASLTPRENKYRLILLLIACAGCRPHEAVALNNRSFANTSYTKFFVENRKVSYMTGGRPRMDEKHAPKWLGQELRAYVRKYWSGIVFNDGYLFPSDRPTKYKHMRPASFNAWFVEKRRQLGFLDIVGINAGSNKAMYRVEPYSFRRWFATYLYDKGTPVRVIAKLMGHKNSRITEGYIEQQKLWDAAAQAVEKFPELRLFDEGQQMLQAFS